MREQVLNACKQQESCTEERLLIRTWVQLQVSTFAVSWRMKGGYLVYGIWGRQAAKVWYMELRAEQAGSEGREGRGFLKSEEGDWHPMYSSFLTMASVGWAIQEKEKETWGSSDWGRHKERCKVADGAGLWWNTRKPCQSYKSKTRIWGSPGFLGISMYPWNCGDAGILQVRCEQQCCITSNFLHSSNWQCQKHKHRSAEHCGCKVKESRGRKCLGLAVFLNEGHLSSLGGSHRALLFNLLG